MGSVKKKSEKRDLLKQIEQIKKDNVEVTSLLNQNLSLYFATDRREHLQNLIVAYLNDAINEISILNVADAATVFKLFKELLAEHDTESVGKETVKTMKDFRLKTMSLTSTISKRKGELVKSKFRKSKYRCKTPPKLRVQGTNVSSFPSTGNRVSSKINKISTSTSSCQQSEQPFISNKSFILPATSFTAKFPGGSKLWNQFCNSSYYKSRHKDFTDNEAELKATRADYLDEMKTLLKLTDVVEKKKLDVIDVGLFKHSNKFCVTYKVDKTFLKEAEALCKKGLEDAIENLQIQKKSVLELQTLLRTLVDQRRRFKEQLNNDFAEFYKKNT